MFKNIKSLKLGRRLPHPALCGLVIGVVSWSVVNVSDAIAEEILKIAAVTDQLVSENLTGGQEHEANQAGQEPCFHRG